MLTRAHDLVFCLGTGLKSAVGVCIWGLFVSSLLCSWQKVGAFIRFGLASAMASKQLLKELKDLHKDTSTSCSAGNKDDDLNAMPQKVEQSSNLKEHLEEKERMARVNAAWEAMNRGLPSKPPKTSTSKPTLTGNKITKKMTPDWMVALGLAPKRSSAAQSIHQRKPDDIINGEEAKKLAAAALSAVRDVTSAAAASAGRGKVEITEVKDFAGEEIEVKKLVDADSREAAEKAKVTTGPPSALDSVLEQIRKKPKLSVLDKTKKDWGEFKDDNKGLEEELDAYKKSSNQYLDRVSFLQRTDIREFERERDARLAVHAKRRPDMREDGL